MTLPTIHRNGTAPRDLLDGLCDAGRAINDAIKAVCEAGPNGRDYYPQGQAAMSAAQSEHESRLERLRSVLTEIQQLAEHVSDHC
jgi:hypothetical protein